MNFKGKIFWYIVLSTIPAGILSLVLDKIADKVIGDNLNLEMLVIAIALIVLGIVLYLVDERSKSTTDYEHITFKNQQDVGKNLCQLRDSFQKRIKTAPFGAV